MDYPILEPLPIKTKGFGWWKKLWIWISATRKFKVREDYTYYIPWLDVTVLIPAGFIFDGASIPRMFWPLLSPTGILFIPGLLHDYGYKYNHWLNENSEVIHDKAGQKFFDTHFAKMGKDINDMKVLDSIAYGALRGFGWMSWRKHRKFEIEQLIYKGIKEIDKNIRGE